MGAKLQDASRIVARTTSDADEPSFILPSGEGPFALPGVAGLACKGRKWREEHERRDHCSKAGRW